MAATCLNCDFVISELNRSDKKFCCGICRSEFNNKMNSAANNYVRKTNNNLSKNRRILQKYMPMGVNSVVIPRDNLRDDEFNFNLHTGSEWHEPADNLIYYCYEYGYIDHGSGKVTILLKAIK